LPIVDKKDENKKGALHDANAQISRATRASIRVSSPQPPVVYQLPIRCLSLRALALFGCDHENVAGHLGHFLATALGAVRL
jgi:hypothetical protein